MQIVYSGDNLHEMSNPVFRGKKYSLSSAEFAHTLIKFGFICFCTCLFMPFVLFISVALFVTKIPIHCLATESIVVFQIEGDLTEYFKLC